MIAIQRQPIAFLHNICITAHGVVDCHSHSIVACFSQCHGKAVALCVGLTAQCHIVQQQLQLCSAHFFKRIYIAFPVLERNHRLFAILQNRFQFQGSPHSGGNGAGGAAGLCSGGQPGSNPHLGAIFHLYLIPGFALCVVAAAQHNEAISFANLTNLLIASARTAAQINHITCHINRFSHIIANLACS